MKLSAPNDGTAVALAHRVYATAFPKAGTHLIETMLRQFAAPWTERPWLGTFEDHAWSAQWVDLSRFYDACENWPAGTYLKGHAGHSHDIAKALWDGAIATLFVYRDLRDVAVSSAYHWLNESRDEHGEYSHKHPGKAILAGADIQTALLAVINGLDRFPGLAERWRLYEGWRRERWVFQVRYEDMLLYTEETASRIFRYVAGMMAAFYGAHMKLNKADHDTTVALMVAASREQKLVTYRRGITGEWQELWNDDIARAWRDSGAKAANEELGYELGQFTSTPEVTEIRAYA